MTWSRYCGFWVFICASQGAITFFRAKVQRVNLQPRRDGTAKPYQVKQVRQVITRYQIAGEGDAI
jgi:hypothetical protein